MHPELGGDGVGVLGAQEVYVDLVGPREEGKGFLGLSSGGEETGDVVESGGHLDVALFFFFN